MLPLVAHILVYAGTNTHDKKYLVVLCPLEAGLAGLFVPTTSQVI
jgi:hypothetical protein